MPDRMTAAFENIATTSDPTNTPALLQPQGYVLAFDFGEKRIGVAIGEHLLGIAHPLTTISSEANGERFRIIGELIVEWQPQKLVVGLPFHLDGEEWSTDGRVVLNLNPVQAIAHFRQELERVE